MPCPALISRGPYSLPASRHAVIGLAAILWLAGCLKSPIELTGRPCENGQCISEFTCDILKDVCVQTADSCEEADRAIICADGETVRTCVNGGWTECLVVPCENSDDDEDGICNASDDCTDADGDGIGTGTLENIGCLDSANDTDDNDPTVCADVDGDTCEDCLSGTWNIGDDGPDADSDGICDAGDSCPGDETAGTNCGDCRSCDGAGACVDDCDDGVFCNGEESCNPAGGCLAGTPPCAGTECNGCDEAADSCFDTVGTACTDDGIFCNGPEQCNAAGACVSAGNPCTGLGECGLCNEVADNCFTPAGTVCSSDGQFCTGNEECDGLGACVSQGDPCLPASECNNCNEAADNCFDPATTACGDPSTTDCSNPDYCDGAGTCLDNHQGDGGACDDCPTTAPVCQTCSAGLCPDVLGCTPGVIAFDAANFFNQNGVSQLVWSHTTTSAADGKRIMLVGVGIGFNDGDETVVTLTYGGVDLTFLDSATSGTGNGESRIEVWYLLNPASGADDVVVNLGGAGRVAAGSMTFTGVDQVAPEAVNTGAQSASASGEPTGTMTTITDNAWVVDMLTWRRDRTATPGSAQTERYQVTQHWAVAGSTVGPVTPPATITMDWTVTMDPSWAQGIVSLAPECL